MIHDEDLHVFRLNYHRCSNPKINYFRTTYSTLEREGQSVNHLERVRHAPAEFTEDLEGSEHSNIIISLGWLIIRYRMFLD